MAADFPSRLDLFAIGRDFVLQRVNRIDPEQVNTDGSDANIIVASAANVGFVVVLQLAQRVNSLLLDGAIGEDLDRLALDRFQLTRKGASAAVGEVRFFRTDTSVGAGSVAIGTRLQTLTGVEYITTSQATFGATDTEATANARAVQAGKTTQVGANTIRRIANPGLLFDPSLQVNNGAAMAGGEDAEDDDTFRERVRDFFSTVRRGTLGAIEFGALQVPGIVSAQALESLDPNTANPARVVNLFVADGSGVASAALGQQVRNSLEDFRAAGITVLTNTSLPQIVQVQLDLTFQAGVDTTNLTENIRAAVVEFVNSLPVNGTLFRGQLFSVLQRFAADGLIPDQNSVTSPTGDLVPTTGRTLRTTLSNVTVV